MAECRELDETVQRYGRVFQAGTQRRNVANFRHAIELAHSGSLGKHPHRPRLDLSSCTKPSNGCPRNPNPRRKRSIGIAGSVPLHGAPTTSPTSAASGAATMISTPAAACWTGVPTPWTSASGRSAWTAPRPVEFEPDDGQTIHARYANGVKLVMRRGGFNGEGKLARSRHLSGPFRGRPGLGRGRRFRENRRQTRIAVRRIASLTAWRAPTPPPTSAISSIASNPAATTASNSATTRSSHVACHAAAIAWRLGRKLTFDPATESFVNDEDANRMRSRARRAPWHA